VGAASAVTQDVLPYSMTVSDRPIRTFGANRTGLERRGFDAKTIDALQKAFRILSRSGLNTSQAVARIRAEIAACPEVEEILAFIETSERGVIK